MELLPWDCWDVILSEQMDDPNDLAMLDKVAALIANYVPNFETVRTRYEYDRRLLINGTLLSYVNGGMVGVNRS